MIAEKQLDNSPGIINIWITPLESTTPFKFIFPLMKDWVIEQIKPTEKPMLRGIAGLKFKSEHAE